MKTMQWILGVSIALFLVFSVNAAFQLPAYDEAIFLNFVEGVDRFGLPSSYWGEGKNTAYGQDSADGSFVYLEHPHFYPLILIGVNSLFDNVVFTVRFVSIVMSLLTAFVLFLLGRELHSKAAGVLAASVYLLIPAVIQYSLQLSMDSVMFPFLLSLALYGFLRYEKGDRWWLVGVVVLMFFAFWTKLTTPMLLLFSVFVYYVLKKQWLKAIWLPLLVGLLSGGLFLLTWALYALHFGFDWLFIITGTLLNRGLLDFGSVISHILRSGYDVFFVGLAFLLLLLRGMWKRLGWKRQPIDLLVVYTIIIWALYSIRTPGLYYKIPAIATAAVIVGVLLASHTVHEQLRFVHLVWMAVLATVYFFLPDMILLLPDLLPVSSSFGWIIFLLLLSLAPVVIGLVMGFFKPRQMLLYLFVLLVGFSLGVNAQQAFVPYSTISNYGNSGFASTVEYIQLVSNRSDVMIVPRDIGFYVADRFYWEGELHLRNNCGIASDFVDRPHSSCGVAGTYEVLRLRDVVNRDDIRWVVVSSFYDEYRGGLRPDVVDDLEAMFVVDRTIGDYTVYINKISHSD